MSVDTYRNFNEEGGGIPVKPKSNESGFWSFLKKKQNMHNLVDPKHEAIESKRRGEEFTHETEPFTVFFHTIALAFHSFFTALVYILSTTMQPLNWTAPITATEFWINSFGRTAFFVVLMGCVQFISACPGYQSILTCIRTPFLAFFFAPKGEGTTIFVKSLFVNIWYIGVIFGCWCAADTAGAYWNQEIGRAHV